MLLKWITDTKNEIQEKFTNFLIARLRTLEKPASPVEMFVPASQEGFHKYFDTLLSGFLEKGFPISAVEVKTSLSSEEMEGFYSLRLVPDDVFKNKIIIDVAPQHFKHAQNLLIKYLLEEASGNRPIKGYFIALDTNGRPVSKDEMERRENPCIRNTKEKE